MLRTKNSCGVKMLLIPVRPRRNIPCILLYDKTYHWFILLGMFFCYLQTFKKLVTDYRTYECIKFPSTFLFFFSPLIFFQKKLTILKMAPHKLCMIPGKILVAFFCNFRVKSLIYFNRPYRGSRRCLASYEHPCYRSR